MACSPRDARAHLDCLIDLAGQAADFHYTVKVGGLPLTIQASPEAQPIFYRGQDRIISKRHALQLIEVYHG
jgi:hypothetical protein